MNETLPPQRPPQPPDDPADRDPAAGENRELARGSACGAGDRLGPYLIEAKIGEGGMGKVYRCLDPTLKRQVAVKVLHDKYVRDPRYKARFLREAQTVANVSHPGVAQVYSIDTTGGSLSIVMEYVDGYSLEERLERDETIAIEEAVGWVRQAAEGLQAALVQGIIHRDIKPSNLLVNGGGRVKVVDFGLAKDLAASTSLTDDGIVLGTPQYISPEQGRGKKVDQRSDIYSLGATFYHLITGRPPFTQESQIAVIVAHVQEKPPAPHELRGQLPDDVSRVIGRMMATAPEDRYPNYGELIEDLDCLQHNRRVLHASNGRGRFVDDARQSRRPSRLGIGLVLLMSLVLGAILVGLPDGRSDIVHKLREQLDTWYVHRPDGGDVLKLDFSNPPTSSGDILHEVFVFSAAEKPHETAPNISDGCLQWQNFSQPIACAYPFERVKDIQLYVKDHSSRFDLGIYLVHPDGNKQRSLGVPLRPADEQPRPIFALRSNNEVQLSSKEVEPLPRLRPPYKITLELAEDGDSTRVTLRIDTIDRERKSRVTVYNRDYVLKGNNWKSGVLILKSASSRAFSISLEELVISGKVRGDRITEVPWQS